MIDLVIYKTWEGEPHNETKALLIRENREEVVTNGVYLMKSQ